jgi:hypothetical protein
MTELEKNLKPVRGNLRGSYSTWLHMKKGSPEHISGLEPKTSEEKSRIEGQKTRVRNLMEHEIEHLDELVKNAKFLQNALRLLRP